MQPNAYTESSLRSFLILVALVAVSQLAGVTGSLVTDPSFYGKLAHPSWAPPAWLFAPVWVVLYTLMGVAAWLVWRTGPGRRGALTWFAIQLVLNAAWTPVFFGLGSIGGGLIVIVVLEIAIITTIIAFARRSRIAAALLLPYAAWVAFATALNAALWAANR